MGEYTTINEISENHRKWIRDMGWEGTKTDLEQIALIYSEVTELSNEVRYDPINLEKVGHEMADIILRVISLSHYMNVDIETAILDKMQINIEKGNRGRIK